MSENYLWKLSQIALNTIRKSLKQIDIHTGDLVYDIWAQKIAEVLLNKKINIQ